MKFIFESIDTPNLEYYNDDYFDNINIFINDGDAAITFTAKSDNLLKYSNLFPNSYIDKCNTLNDTQRICIDSNIKIGYMFIFGDVCSIHCGVIDILQHGCDNIQQALLFSGMMHK